MDKVCINCKWYYNATCNCKDFIRTINIVDNDTRYISYIEEGYFSENIRENIDIKELGKNYIKMLIEQDYIKKNKDIKKINLESEEMEIFEYIEFALYKSIQNYFEGNAGADIKINNPDEFSCCYWE